MSERVDKHPCPECGRPVSPNQERSLRLLAGLTGFLVWLPISWPQLMEFEHSTSGAIVLAVSIATLVGSVLFFVWLMGRDRRRKRQNVCTSCGRSTRALPLWVRTKVGWVFAALMWAWLARAQLFGPEPTSEAAVSLSVVAVVLAGCAFMLGRLARDF